jgi:DNA-binding NtrC family response regulator
MGAHKSVSSNPATRIQAIDANAVIGLAISQFDQDLSFLQRMFDDASGKLYTACTYREAMVELSRERVRVVLCERQLPDGSWKDVLGRLAPILDRPRLIVISRCADEGLWTEVLNMGGFDLLATPLQEVEVAYTVGSACADWIDERQRNGTRVLAAC